MYDPSHLKTPIRGDFFAPKIAVESRPSDNRIPGRKVVNRQQKLGTNAVKPRHSWLRSRPENRLRPGNGYVVRRCDFDRTEIRAPAIPF